jgi:adenine-specific DNA-methyltransferase
MLQNAFNFRNELDELPKFPSTRYQGSKRKLICELNDALSDINFSSALDLFSGSGTVSLLLRFMGKTVTSNDYIAYNANTAKLFLTATNEKISSIDWYKTLVYSLETASLNQPCIVTERFDGVFFMEHENKQIDRFCQTIQDEEPFTRCLLIYAVGQALMMKRPYNLFHRANLNMRSRNVKRSFGNAKTWETPILDHASKIIRELEKFPFPCGLENHRTFEINTVNLRTLPMEVELVYLDPPYLNKRGAGTDYIQFYHFLDGLCDYTRFYDADESLANRPIIKQESRWNKHLTALEELSEICDYWRDSTLVFSYRNDGLPTNDEICDVFFNHGRAKPAFLNVDYKYALSHGKETKEQIIVSTP